MIRILNKSLLKERTVQVQAFTPITLPTRSFSRYRQYVIRQAPASAFRNSSFLSLSPTRLSKACFSTVPGHAKVKTKPEVPPPPTATPPRKPKVDLRPAPKKPSPQPRSPSQLPPPTPPAAQMSHTSSATPPAQPIASTSSTFTTPGPLETTKHDISEATKHGILLPPPADASRLGRVWHQFKQLFWFYWGGLKLIFVTHRRQAAMIRRHIAEAKARGEEMALSRTETRFLRTYDRDRVKLVPFVLILLILEEALPFVVLYAPGLLPSTCLLPSQRQRIEAKRRAKQTANAASLQAELMGLQAQGQDIATLVTEQGVASLGANLTRAVAGTLSRPTWGPLFLQRRRIQKHLAYLSADDGLLVKEGLGSRLDQGELMEALEERGFVADSQSLQHMRDRLQRWLNAAKDEKARLRLVLQATAGEGEK